MILKEETVLSPKKKERKKKEEIEALGHEDSDSAWT